MTAIPPTFTFSQSSLQAFEDCPRRFWLAYIEQLPWPAVEASPVQEHEALMRQGEHFHRLVQRVEIGIDPDEVGAALTPPLSTWFAAYRAHRPADLPTEFVEIERVLSVTVAVQGETEEPEEEKEQQHTPAPSPIPQPPNLQSPNLQSPNLQSSISNLPISPPSAFRLAAKFDLIAAESGGRVVIVDWKTAQRRSDPAVCAAPQRSCRIASALADDCLPLCPGGSEHRAIMGAGAPRAGGDALLVHGRACTACGLSL